ncbi:MAG: hypothetical protein ACI88L_000599, partial [Candidatus Paceibacteria bacterium]
MSITVKKFLSPFLLLSIMFAFYSTPLIASASSHNTCTYVSGGLDSLINQATCLLTRVIPLLVTAAVVVFVYGIVTYIRNAENAEKRKEGNLFMMYGLIALFVMVSIWALVGI